MNPTVSVPRRKFHPHSEVLGDGVWLDDGFVEILETLHLTDSDGTYALVHHGGAWSGPKPA